MALDCLSMDIALTGEGAASVSERHRDESDVELYDSEELFGDAVDDIELSVEIDAEGLCQIAMSGYHMVDAESGRGFHANLRLHLDANDINHLYHFLRAMRKIGP